MALPPVATNNMRANKTLQPSCCHQAITRCGWWLLLVPLEVVDQSSNSGREVMFVIHEMLRAGSGYHVTVLLQKSKIMTG
jgi:hypothetical protein